MDTKVTMGAYQCPLCDKEHPAVELESNTVLVAVLREGDEDGVLQIAAPDETAALGLFGSILYHYLGAYGVEVVDGIIQSTVKLYAHARAEALIDKILSDMKRRNDARNN